jgi:ABC-type transport system involved in cytochrome bd biosynthesis fused ATPase/permease subunit
LSNSISPDFTLDINDTVISLSETRSLNIHNFKLSSGLFRLYGSSGSGKTSFLRHLCGIYCAEPPIASYNAKSTDFMQFAYVGQQSVLLEGNLFKNITLSDIDDKEIASKYFHCLDIVGLNYLGADFYAPKSCINVGSLGRELSGGEVQRIGIARALFATNRPFVIFDEALSGVDEKNRDNILRYCMRQSEELHRIFIIASHIDVPQVSGCIKISEDANLTFVKQ